MRTDRSPLSWTTLVARTLAACTVLLTVSLGLPARQLFSQQRTTPNFVIIFLDDSGWADFQPFANPGYPTPNVDQLASEGCRLNNFYVPQGICSASRAALLTGSYPGRTKMFGAHGPNARGVDPQFATIGDMLQPAGYTTAAFGKWHIGDQPDTRPPARGFNESVGLMYSNDMWKHHPENPEQWGKHPLQYWENGKVTIPNVTPKDQTMLTTWYTEHAVDFINRNENHPFFLYVAHSMPHVPLFVSEKFRGKSGAGLYGDVMMEIDWSVGQIMKALKANGLEENTMVIFTSDNGPWAVYGNHAGKTPFREAKGTSFDGGIRSATIIKYPGKIQPGTASNGALCSIDILPTIAYLADAQLPDNEIDGRNVWDLIANKAGAQNPHAYYAFSTANEFEAVMSGDGKWKLHLPHQYRHVVRYGEGGFPGEHEQREQQLALYDLEADPYERMNVIDDHPDIAKKLEQLAKQHREQFYAE
ncbi:MAG: sulfatase-like hydrolase/transferase [Luteitalea sp.]|nr:sulfatase-like hydrolase/transferase [Luteitalea sp.]